MSYAIKVSETKDSTAHNVSLTVDWTGVSDDDLKQWALQSIIIKVQAQLRAAKVKHGTAFPAAKAIKAVDYRVGSRVMAIAETPEQMLARLTPEERAALFEKYL